MDISKPTGVADGDILILLLYWEAVPPDLSLPSGFAEVVTGGYGSVSKLAAYWKRASSEGSTYTTSWTGSVFNVSMMAAFSGCRESGSAIDVSAAGTGANASSITYPSVTTTVADTMLVLVGASYWGSENAPSGFSTAIGSGGGSGAIFYKSLAATGSTGTFTGSTGFSENALGHTIALMPPGAAAKAPPPFRKPSRYYTRRRAV